MLSVVGATNRPAALPSWTIGSPNRRAVAASVTASTARRPGDCGLPFFQPITLPLGSNDVALRTSVSPRAADRAASCMLFANGCMSSVHQSASFCASLRSLMQ